MEHRIALQFEDGVTRGRAAGSLLDRCLATKTCPNLRIPQSKTCSPS